jgi:hypothetical protein
MHGNLGSGCTALLVSMPSVSATVNAACFYAHTILQQRNIGRSDNYLPLLLQVFLPNKTTEPHAVLRVLLPPNYPSAAGPVMELEAPGAADQQLAAAVRHMEEMYTPGKR